MAAAPDPEEKQLSDLAKRVLALPPKQREESKISKEKKAPKPSPSANAKNPSPSA